MAESIDALRVKQATHLALMWIKVRVGLCPDWTTRQVEILAADLKLAAEACGQDVGTLLKTVGAALDEADPALAECVRRTIESEARAERFSLMKRA